MPTTEQLFDRWEDEFYAPWSRAKDDPLYRLPSIREVENHNLQKKVSLKEEKYKPENTQSK